MDFTNFTLLTAAEDWVKDGRIGMGCEAIGVCHEQRLSCSSTLFVCGFLVCSFSSFPTRKPQTKRVEEHERRCSWHTPMALSLSVVFLFVVLAAFPPTLFGQAVFGSISGSVSDPSGAGIPGAKVIIIDAGKGVSYNTSTNESGFYTQSHLIVGLYEIHIEASGFGAYVQRNVSVEVDAVTQVNARLTIGQLGQVVNVSGEVPLLKTERSDVSDTITQKSVQELPVLQRDMSRLYFLIPGVQASGTTAASEQPHDVYRPKIGGQYWGGIAFQL